MKFGKLEDISGLNFSLPEEPTQNTTILKDYKEAKTCNVYIGSTGWSNPKWKGNWYPKKTKTTDFLKAYGRQFNTIELNTTYYRLPEQERIIKWKETVPADFKFCPKVVKWISHKKDLAIHTDEIMGMIDRFVFFEEKLGTFFMQLPPYFGYEKIDVLARFLETFPSDLKLSIELRHKSWYETTERKKELQQLVYSTGHHLLLTDVSGRRDVLHMLVTNNYMLVRWVGNGLHDTDYTRIDEWVQKLLYYKRLGMRDIYFFPHEPDNLLAPEISNYLCSKLLHYPDFNVRGPQPLEQEDQLKLF